jgi:hypothetical protein
VIHKITGSIAPELVGQAVAREERDRKRREWQLEEDKRIKTVLDERNAEVRLKRTQWIADENRRRKNIPGMDQKSLWAKLTDGLLIVIGLPLGLALLYVLLLLLSEFLGWFLIVVAGIVGAIWFYSSVKADEAKRQQELQAEAGRQFPWVNEEDIPRRTMPSFEGGRTSEGVARGKPASISERASNALKDTRRGGCRFYRTKNGVGDKTTGTVNVFGVLKRSVFPVPGYWSPDFGFVSDDEIEIPVLEGGKAISSCPQCGLKCRGNAVAVAEITCPSCRTVWKQRFDS